MPRPSKNNLSEYETITVLKPTLEDSQVLHFINKTKELVAKQGGVHLKTSNWGLKKLGWEHDRTTKGIYIHHRYLAPGALISEYERQLRIDESVMIRQTVVLNKNIDPSTAVTEEDVLQAPVQEYAPPPRYNQVDDE